MRVFKATEEFPHADHELFQELKQWDGAK